MHISHDGTIREYGVPIELVSACSFKKPERAALELLIKGVKQIWKTNKRFFSPKWHLNEPDSHAF